MTWELKLMEWTSHVWRSPVLDRVLPWLTHLGSLVAVLIFILLCGLLTRRRSILLRLLPLYLAQSVVLYGLKFLVHRPRPPLFLSLGIVGGPGEILDPSFPSGHSLNAFMMATLLAHWFPRYRYLFFGIAAWVGWTRIYLGLHYPTDVLAGGLLGYGLTRVFLYWMEARGQKIMLT